MRSSLSDFEHVGIGPDSLSDGQIVMAKPALTLGLPANGSGTTVGATTVFDGDHAQTRSRCRRPTWALAP